MIDQFRDKYRFLSNFYPAKVHLNGCDFTSVEHAFQAAKTLSFTEREIIRRSQTPGQAKRLGKTVKLRPGWEFIKVWQMYELVSEKFSPGSELAAQLEETGDEELVEGNSWRDSFWGKISAASGRYLHGENYLGRILMEVRAQNRED